MGFVFLVSTLLFLPSKAWLLTNWWLKNSANHDQFPVQTDADRGATVLMEGGLNPPVGEVLASHSLTCKGHRCSVLAWRIRAIHHTWKNVQNSESSFTNIKMGWGKSGDRIEDEEEVYFSFRILSSLINQWLGGWGKNLEVFLILNSSSWQVNFHNVLMRVTVIHDLASIYANEYSTLVFPLLALLWEPICDLPRTVVLSIAVILPCWPRVGISHNSTESCMTGWANSGSWLQLLVKADSKRQWWWSHWLCSCHSYTIHGSSSWLLSTTWHKLS